MPEKPPAKVTFPKELLDRPAEKRSPESFRHVHLSLQPPVATLTLDRPEHNLLNEPMLRELAAGLEQISQTADVTIIVIEAAGTVFCGGMDIGEYIPERAFLALDAFHAVCTKMIEATQPVLVVVNGPAIGGGAELAAFGDLVLATPRARFALPEITIGMFPTLASTVLPLIIGPKLTLEMVLTGEPISAERACELGLVNRLVPEKELEHAVAELLARLTAQSGAVMAMAKKAVLGGLGLSLRDALCFSKDVFLNELFHLEDSREGLRALVEKRKPQWKNR
jgi:cyclohexa-1,5-dienecarbonyl-CoA hydratase